MNNFLKAHTQNPEYSYNLRSMTEYNAYNHKALCYQIDDEDMDEVILVWGKCLDLMESRTDEDLIIRE